MKNRSIPMIFVIPNCHEIESLAMIGREVIPEVSELRV
jgi:hypothetical protein